MIRSGRRSGKTVIASIIGVEGFLAGKRILYAAPTEEQIDRFWTEVCRALIEPVDRGIFYKNETKHIIELPGTEQRIRAKTAWNADTLRGDYADLLILDEFQLMAEDAWSVVGAPMLADHDGDAVFIFTPPSLRSLGRSKAKDPQHANKLFRRAQADKSGRWEVFKFTSLQNPYISQAALQELTGDMTDLAYRQEILAEDVDEAPGALWHHQDRIGTEGKTLYGLDTTRVTSVPEFELIVVGVDPSASSGGDEAGIITAGRAARNYYTLEDNSIQGSPETWARAAITAYHKYKANYIVAEKNNGGEMVLSVLKQIDVTVPVRLVSASRGKATRAEPIAAIYEQGRAHHVGVFPALELEMTLWTPGDVSPNRMDALVWAMTLLSKGGGASDKELENYAAGIIDEDNLDDEMRQWLLQSGVKLKGKQ